MVEAAARLGDDLSAALPPAVREGFAFLGTALFLYSRGCAAVATDLGNEQP
jgi:hypothetical protein